MSESVYRREDLVEKIGVKATNYLLDLSERLDEWETYFGLARVACATGHKLVNDISGINWRNPE